MHSEEVDIDIDLVRKLVLTQFPQWSDLPLASVRSTGTVNAIYRLGDDLYLRMPRLPGWHRDLEKEMRWLRLLAPLVRLAVPEPVAKGDPAFGYPFVWAVYRWMEGVDYTRGAVHDEQRAATDLATFVRDLRCVDTGGAPRSRRDSALAERDVASRAAIKSLHDAIDTSAVTYAWERSLRAPIWDGEPVWTHGDLLPPNLLVRNGELRSVLDFGNVGVGDPAVDVIAAWSVFGADARDTFRSDLSVDDDTWERARGFALAQALLIIPYYVESNPGFANMATRTVEEILDDVAP